MPDVELILALMVAVAIIATAAHLWRVPYPILLVLGGLLLAVTPGIQSITLAPDLIFLLFLPPLVYIAGFETSPRDIKAQLRPILSLAVGLALASTLFVGVVAHALLPEFGWPVAFALGGILAATDAVAATALMRDIGAPRRVVTLVESESLFNDATALVAYQVALGAAAAASFSFFEADVRIVVAAVGGILIGLAVGWGIVLLRKFINDTPVEITISLLTPFAAYLPAQHLGVSGVLACATCGVLVGWYAPRIMSSETRVRGRAVWDFLVFGLNGLAFILVGLQLSTVLAQRPLRSLGDLIAITAVIAVAVILVRFVWVFGAAAVEMLRRWLHTRTHSGGAPVQAEQVWRESTVVSWAGLRGVVSLAAALALPLDLDGRNVLLFITFGVILVTLVGQGLTLPLVIRLLRLGGDDTAQRDEVHARTIAAEAAVARIDELAREWPGHLPLIDTLRSQYAHRATHLGEAHETQNGTARDVDAEQELLEHRLIRREVIDAERRAVLRLRDRGAINDEAWRAVERDLDLEELRMEA
jgi:CPA1 family monovalent cation:H+ antiporter